MTINEMKDKCSSQINDLVLRAFRLGFAEGTEEGSKAADRYDVGYIDGALDLMDALLDDDFLDSNYDSRSPEDVLTDFKVSEILKDHKEFVEKQKINECWTQLETSTNNHKIRAKCQNCGYLMDWDDRTKYCPECGNHNMEE